MTVLGVLKVDRRHVSDAAVQPDGIEPVDLGQGRELKIVDAAPGLLSTDAFGLVEPDD